MRGKADIYLLWCFLNELFRAGVMRMGVHATVGEADRHIRRAHCAPRIAWRKPEDTVGPLGSAPCGRGSRA